MPRVFLLHDDPFDAGPAAGLPRDRFLTAGRPTGAMPRTWAEAAVAAVGFAPHVVHARGPVAARLAGALARVPRFGLARGTRVVVSDVDPVPPSGLVRRAVLAADRVIASTEAEAARLREAGVPAGRVTVVPPGVEPPPTGDPGAVRARFDISPQTRLVVAVGRFDGPDGLTTAAVGFDALKYPQPDAFLLVVGIGPDRGRGELTARAIGFDDYRTRFAPPDTDRREAITAADVVWVTAGRGAVGALLDAMAAGKPVVAAGPPEFAEVLGRPTLPPGDRIGLAAATKELFADPGRAAALGAAARERALQAFPPGPVVDRFAALYDV